MTCHHPFVIDHACSDHEYLFVDILGIATVVIKIEAEGIVVDIFPGTCADGPVATTWAHYTDLIDPDPADP